VSRGRVAHTTKTSFVVAKAENGEAVLAPRSFYLLIIFGPRLPCNTVTDKSTKWQPMNVLSIPNLHLYATLSNLSRRSDGRMYHRNSNK
jgi:hypothetical protein